MSLHDALTHSVTRSTRDKGAELYAAGRLRLNRHDKGCVGVSVRDRRWEHEVHLRVAGRRLFGLCDCPHAEQDLVVCKHIWAATLEASEKQCFEGLNIRALELDFAALGVEFDDDDSFIPNRPVPRVARTSLPPPPAPPKWKSFFDQVRVAQPAAASIRTETLPEGSEIIYQIDVDELRLRSIVTIETTLRTLKKNGQLSKPRPMTAAQRSAEVMDPVNREILALMGPARSGYYSGSSSRHELPWPAVEYLLPKICQSGRLWLRNSAREHFMNIRWDDGPPWSFVVSIQRDDENKQFRFQGELARNGTRKPLQDALCLLSGGFAFFRDAVARFDDRGCFAWVVALRREEDVTIPFAEAPQLREAMLRIGNLPEMELPPELTWTEVSVAPRPRLRVSASNLFVGGDLSAELLFDYDGSVLESRTPPGTWFDETTQRLIRRDASLELGAERRLDTLGLKVAWNGSYKIAPERLSEVIRILTNEGWQIESEKGTYRAASSFDIRISSGIDWFDLSAEAAFGEAKVALPQLLAALEADEEFIRLDDGSVGLIPDAWLRRLEPLLTLGATNSEGAIRFRPNQIGLIDALLAARPEISCDEVLAAARVKLNSFRGIEPGAAPQSFRGKLRPYQNDGLGWFAFLEDMGFGGCLADDMGLGKTVQVLALLESRRLMRETEAGGLPSLVVVPRSLVFNWKEEAGRFTPELRLLDHTGVDRPRSTERLRDYDVVLTTYGTLRRDIVSLAEAEFDYVILDEAQAIKNSSSQSARAARLLRGRHRLALSGTPIENHIGELWSLFEFLNPGMFGKSAQSRLPSLLEPGQNEEQRSLLARALRPFILRRTKDQVAPELPARSEQTIHCELEGKQRELYEELRDHYRNVLLGKIRAEGLNKSKIQILEALLRLRQAACHPGLIDRTRAGEESAKLESLLSNLAVVLAEGHKAIVFSQFTSMLAIVRDRLDQKKIDYCYLDGKSRDRQQQVERFQNEPEPLLFLISLKAGGLGLNLTAAEYVYLFDPWWNPAVEAQAIDRAHRIGQQRQVFAYRLVARDTIEEKILALQQTKRDLASAIIGGTSSLIRDLKTEDLELLLS